MVGKHAVAGMASEAGGDWLVGDVGGCQAAAHLGLSRTLFWHRLKLLPAIGGTSVPFPSERLGTVWGYWSAACAPSLRMPPTNHLAQFPADGEIKVHRIPSAIAGRTTALKPRLSL